MDELLSTIAGQSVIVIVIGYWLRSEQSEHKSDVEYYSSLIERYLKRFQDGD